MAVGCWQRDADLDTLYAAVHARNRVVADHHRQPDSVPFVVQNHARGELQRAFTALLVNGFGPFATPGPTLVRVAGDGRPLRSPTGLLMSRHPEWQLPFERLTVDQLDEEDEPLLAALGFCTR